MPILIPEAPIVNPNAALGTPPRLNSDGEAEHDIEEVNHSETEEGNCNNIPTKKTKKKLNNNKKPMRIIIKE